MKKNEGTGSVKKKGSQGKQAGEAVNAAGAQDRSIIGENEWDTQDFVWAQTRLDRVAAWMKIDQSALEPLRRPKRALCVIVPVRLDNGSVRTFAGYRVHHDLALGPGKGGVQFHPRITLGEVASLAMLMTWKCSLMNLPFGGAHGGIRVDPAAHSQAELERLTRRFTSEIIELIGPSEDIPGPDFNTGEQTMAWMMDTYSINVGHTVPSVVTGKPQSIGGSLGILNSSGFGVAHCAKRALRHAGLSAASPTAVIQGLGHVGLTVARCLASAGFSVIAVSDVHGGLHNAKGLDIERLKAHIESTGSLALFPEAEHITNEELLRLPCDVLVPCAVANQIRKDNAPDVRCRILVEGANATITPEADEILDARGIMVVPDILANAAGVTDGYFEWVQGLMRLFWSEDEVYRRLAELVDRACDRVFAAAEKNGISLRTSAMSIALERIVEARRLRGLYP